VKALTIEATACELREISSKTVSTSGMRDQYLTFVCPCIASTMISATKKMQQKFFFDSSKLTLHVSDDKFRPSSGAL